MIRRHRGISKRMESKSRWTRGTSRWVSESHSLGKFGKLIECMDRYLAGSFAGRQDVRKSSVCSQAFT